MVGAERKMREIILGPDERQLYEFNAERSIAWMFITLAELNQNG